MLVRVTCKNEEDPIKNEGTVVVTSLSLIFQMLQCSLLSSQRWDFHKIQLIQAIMVVLVTCKYEEDSGTRVVTAFLPL